MKASEFLKLYERGEKDFSKVDLKNVKLEHREFVDIILKGANLHAASLFGSTISSSTASPADLSDLILTRTDTRSLTLNNVDLTNSRLFGNEFYDSYLEKVIFRNATIKQVDFTGAEMYSVDFTDARLIKVQGIQLASLTQDTLKVKEEEFRCGYCKLMVPLPYGAGTAHRNHCPGCGYSKHVDERKGYRNSDCGSLMEPIALTLKKGGEISLVHQCLGCETVDRNRITADDNNHMLFKVYQSSFNLDQTIIQRLEEQGTHIIGPEKQYFVKKVLLIDKEDSP
jgi:uncharacterized protein YjbI with pentapeptide repeats